MLGPSRVKMAGMGVIFCLPCLMFSYAAAEIPLNIEAVLGRMNTAYSRIVDYQATVEVKTFRPGGTFEIQKFLYTFKKPKRIRLDFESPHSGMKMVYPDKDGEVEVRLPGLAHFLDLHLSPDNLLLQGASRQRIDQTDLGLLIEKISHSLMDQRRGPASITEERGFVRIRVLAENHFRKGVVTLYHFLIDQAVWLPVKVEESSSDGHLERTITFQNLRTNLGISDRYFEPDSE